jgi:hypothetical protein
MFLLAAVVLAEVLAVEVPAIVAVVVLVMEVPAVVAVVVPVEVLAEVLVVVVVVVVVVVSIFAKSTLTPSQINFRLIARIPLKWTEILS